MADLIAILIVLGAVVVLGFIIYGITTLIEKTKHSINNHRLTAIFEKWPEFEKMLNKYKSDYSSKYEFYKSTIFPIVQRIDYLREKIPTATASEYQEYSKEIDSLKDKKEKLDYANTERYKVQEQYNAILEFMQSNMSQKEIKFMESLGYVKGNCYE